MIDKKIKKLITKSVKEIIEKGSDKEKLSKLLKTHSQKVHFIPREYRIFGGILQSMNIKFGNFIEILIKNLIESDDRYEIITKYSGKKINVFNLSKENDIIIDEYITNCQTKNIDVDIEFPKLQMQLIKNELNMVEENAENPYLKQTHDIDLLY